MDNQLKIRKVNALSPDPSVEALLHAFLPHRCIEHTHADSILVLTHHKDGEKLVREALGPKVAVIPYAMPGFPLAKAAIAAYEANPEIDAIVVMDHGIFTFAEDSRASYVRMIDYVSRAEAFIEARMKDEPRSHPQPPKQRPAGPDGVLARCGPVIRGACSFCDPSARRRRFFVEARTSPDLVEASLSLFNYL